MQQNGVLIPSISGLHLNLRLTESSRPSRVLIPSISGLHLNLQRAEDVLDFCLNPLYFGATSKSEPQVDKEQAERLNPLYFGATSKSSLPR